MRALGDLIRSPLDAETNRERAARGLTLAEHFRTLRGFELRLVPGHPAAERIVIALRKLAQLEGWIFASTSPKNSADYRRKDRSALSGWALSAAAAAESGDVWPPPPALPAGYSESLRKVLHAAAEAAESAQVIEGHA
jgi:hypothetical protein